MMQSAGALLSDLARPSTSACIRGIAALMSRRLGAIAAACDTEVERTPVPPAESKVQTLGAYQDSVSDMVHSTALEQNFCDPGLQHDFGESGKSMEYAGVTIYGFGTPKADLAKNLQLHASRPSRFSHSSRFLRHFSVSTQGADAHIHTPPTQAAKDPRDDYPLLHRPNVSEMVHGTSLEQNFSDPAFPDDFPETGRTMQYAGVTIHGRRAPKDDPVKPPIEPILVPSRSRQFTADSPIDDVL